ncbi:MFS transporter [Paenibacillus xylaniclasticus]|uniref:MFS transporter n=1 Tax=Paenibacillus xylaniclasticus TaxID=588083 RepID=UPI000FDA1D9C|nr:MULTISPECIES: MFS transporter [Paenibacillus]GFN32212.1 hypothetical protein PCURB6_24720 [Paenibacillus curdlanolyticus]
MARENPYAWLLLSVLWVFTFLGATARFIQSYYQPEMSGDMDVGRGFLSLTWSLGIMISAVCAPVGGMLIDRWGYKKVMVYSGLFGCLSILVVLWFRGPIGYFIGFGIIAGLGGIGSAAGYVLVNNWFKYHRAKALMLIGGAASLGLAVLTPLFVRYKEWLNWVNLYWVLLAVNIVSVLFTILFIKENKQNFNEDDNKSGAASSDTLSAVKTTLIADVKQGFNNFIRYCKIPVVLIVMFALFACGFNMGTVERHLMAIHQVAHVHDAMFISSLSLLGLLEVFGGLLFSFLLDHTNRLLALTILYVMRIGAFIMLFLHLDLSPILFSVIFGASYLGAIPGGILVVTERIEQEGGSIGLQVGVLLLVHQIGGVIAGIAGGVNFDLFHNYQLLIAVDIGLVVICAAAYYMMYLKSASHKKVSETIASN